jgi:hypothetical protein
MGHYVSPGPFEQASQQAQELNPPARGPIGAARTLAGQLTKPEASFLGDQIVRLRQSSARMAEHNKGLLTLVGRLQTAMDRLLGPEPPGEVRDGHVVSGSENRASSTLGSLREHLGDLEFELAQNGELLNQLEGQVRRVELV